MCLSFSSVSPVIPLVSCAPVVSLFVSVLLLSLLYISLLSVRLYLWVPLILSEKLKFCQFAFPYLKSLSSLFALFQGNPRPRRQPSGNSFSRLSSYQQWSLLKGHCWMGGVGCRSLCYLVGLFLMLEGGAIPIISSRLLLRFLVSP